jgi:hypothetical protein
VVGVGVVLGGGVEAAEVAVGVAFADVDGTDE